MLLMIRITQLHCHICLTLSLAVRTFLSDFTSQRVTFLLRIQGVTNFRTEHVVENASHISTHCRIFACVFVFITRQSPVNLGGCLLVKTQKIGGMILHVQISHRSNSEWIQILVVEIAQITDPLILLQLEIAFLSIDFVEDDSIAEVSQSGLIID